jgi:transcriptional regulator with XRE-family HTH domain
MEIGTRIKRVRQELHLTLKDVEAASGVSATHVSEIERNEASPTLGSLSRIAHALGKTPAFFLEENEMGEFSLASAKDRVREIAGEKGSARRPAASGAAVERLTTGVPGGRLQVRRVELPAGSSHRGERHAHAGFEALLVVRGRVQVAVGEQAWELAEGDAIHYDAALAHAYTNASRESPAVLIWAASRRDSD